MIAVDVITTPVRLLRKGLTAPVAAANAWQAMVDSSRDRAERQRLTPGHTDGPGNWLEAIEPAECWRLLSDRRLGRIGFTAHSGRPVIVPVNYTVADQRIVVRSGRGPKLDAAGRGDLVAFEVDDIDLQTQTGWSVAITGRAEWLREPREIAKLAPVDRAPWAAGPRSHLVVIHAMHVGGRRLVASD